MYHRNKIIVKNATILFDTIKHGMPADNNINENGATLSFASFI